jgi:cytochrome bd ubiquinol oxidase subunit I
MLEQLDPVNLARMQFAFTVSIHFIFPSVSIGLASYLMVLEALWLKTGQGLYANLYRYWLKIFAVGFGMGHVLPVRHQLVSLLDQGGTGDRASDGL